MFNAQHVCQHVEALLCCLALVDDDSVVQVATLDEVSLQQRFDVAYKDKGTCGSYLCREILYLVDGSKLRIDNL